MLLANHYVSIILIMNISVSVRTAKKIHVFLIVLDKKKDFDSKRLIVRGWTSEVFRLFF